MKTVVQVEKHTCDFCTDKDQTWNTCFLCGKDLCYECRTRYSRELHTESSEDLCACPDCKMRVEQDPTLLGPLLEIKKLKEESKRYYEDFERRRKVAEAAAKDFKPRR